MMHSTVGTLMWMAPEVFDISGAASYDKRADVYSFGIILWELWTQQVPYEEDGDDVPEVGSWYFWTEESSVLCLGSNHYTDAGPWCVHEVCCLRWAT